MDAAAEEATAIQRRLAAGEDAAVLKKLDPCENEVTHLTGAERAAFVSAVHPVLQKYRRKLDPNLFASLNA